MPKQQAYTQTHYAPPPQPTMSHPTHHHAPPPQPTMSQPTHHHAPPQNEKNRIVAGILALIFGGFGIHKFYLGKIENGVLYLCFFWTGLTFIAGFFEGIMYLAESDESFQERVKYM